MMSSSSIRLQPETGGSTPSSAAGRLGYRVFTVKRPGLGRDIPPGYESLSWVANSATLISGERDAVLVDTFLTIDHGVALAEQVAATGKNLTHIYVTHAHGDHFFGINALKQRFPNVRAVAPAAVVERMRGQLAPEVMDGIFRRLFPGQIPDEPGMAESLEAGSIELEGHSLIPVATGHTDTPDSTSLHVGHKIPDHDDDPRHIAETRQFWGAANAAKSAGS